MPKPRKGCFEDFKALYQDRLDFTKPFAVHVHKQLKAEAKLSHNRLKRALGYHCDSVEYLQSVIQGDKRYGLDGEVGTDITEKEKAHALKRLTLHIQKERDRANHLETLYLQERQETRRHRKERKKIHFDFGVMERKLKKMTNKFEDTERRFFSFKRKHDLLDETKDEQSQNRAPSVPPKTAPTKTTPTVVVRKKRRIVTPS